MPSRFFIGTIGESIFNNGKKNHLGIIESTPDK